MNRSGFSLFDLIITGNSHPEFLSENLIGYGITGKLKTVIMDEGDCLGNGGFHPQAIELSSLEYCVLLYFFLFFPHHFGGHAPQLVSPCF